MAELSETVGKAADTHVEGQLAESIVPTPLDEHDTYCDHSEDEVPKNMEAQLQM